MKKTIITIIASIVLIVFVNQAFAQVPQGFNYQAVARNSTGVLLANQLLGVRLVVRQGSAAGMAVYSERQTPTTNQFGLFTVTVGQGTQLSAGAFNAINWSSGNYWLEVGLDVTGGTSYALMGASQLLSVPYAMYSANSGAVPIGNDGQTLRHDGSTWVANDFLFNDGSKIGIGTVTPTDLLDIWGGAGSSYMMFHNNATTASSGRGLKVGLRNDGVPFIWSYENLPMHFGTDVTIRMTIAGDGKVGIGTQSPVGLLNVSGGGSGLGFPTLNLINPDASGVGLHVQSSSTDAAIVVTNSNATGNTIFAKFFDGGAGELINLDDGGGSSLGRMTLFGSNLNTTFAGGQLNGNTSYGLILGDISSSGTYYNIVEMNSTSPTSSTFEPWNTNETSCGSSVYKWTAVWATNGIIQTSDETKKENIKPVSYGLNEVMNLKPVSYQWKDKNALIGNGNSLGFVAQDLEKIIPDVVVHEKISQQEIENAKKVKGIDITETDTYGVKYSELTPVLVKAIQEQQAIINDLQKQVNDLKALIK